MQTFARDSLSDAYRSFNHLSRYDKKHNIEISHLFVKGADLII